MKKTKEENKGRKEEKKGDRERENKYNLIWKVQNHKNEGFMEEEFEMNLEG